MSEFTLLREEIDRLADRTASPDFTDLQRRATRRGRRRIALFAAAAAACVAVAAVVVVVTGHHEHRRLAPVRPPDPIRTAERTIADGHLAGFGVTASGDVLSVWTTCEEDLEPNCNFAWRLGNGARARAVGIVPLYQNHGTGVDVDASKYGFAVNLGILVNLRVTLDGTVLSLDDCRPEELPPLEPGRFVWGYNIAYDREGFYCPTNFGTGERPDPVVDAPSLAGPGGFAADGRLWAVEANSGRRTDPQTIGVFDGRRWRHHRIAARGDSSVTSIAVSGTTVVVLGKSSLSVTRDGGDTWQETTDPDVLRRNLPFLTENQNPECCFRSIAFAGPTLYALGGNGWLWRSHDLTTFDRVRIPGRVRDLSASDGAVIVRLADTEQLVRITADGQLQTITVR